LAPGVALFLALAQHSAAQPNSAQETAQLDSITRWKILNTLIFAIGLGYLIAKTAPAFFNARSADIRKAIEDATGLRIQAEFRSSEMDRKMAALPEEIRKLRQQYAAEMEREHERFRRETEAQIEHIKRNVAAETEAFRLEGAHRVRLHATQLAFESAERRLRERLASEPQDDLVQSFVHLVERGTS
jgi:F0F1-type ATP synthase membrane subunit b/b'